MIKALVRGGAFFSFIMAIGTVGTIENGGTGFAQLIIWIALFGTFAAIGTNVKG